MNLLEVLYPEPQADFLEDSEEGLAGEIVEPKIKNENVKRLNECSAITKKKYILKIKKKKKIFLPVEGVVVD